MKKALTISISGQDGAYLSRLLLQKDYMVIGTSRDTQILTFNRLNKLGIRDKIDVVSMSLNDFQCIEILKCFYAIQFQTQLM